MLYAFFWVIHRWVGTYPPMKMEQTQCFETLAYTIQMLGNYPYKKAYNIQNMAKV